MITVSGPEVASYREAKNQVEKSDHWVRLLNMATAVMAAVAVIVAAIVMTVQVQRITARQVQYHNDSSALDHQLICETAAFNYIITELAAASAHPKTPPVFSYPKPCP